MLSPKKKSQNLKEKQNQRSNQQSKTLTHSTYSDFKHGKAAYHNLEALKVSLSETRQLFWFNYVIMMYDLIQQYKNDTIRC